MPACTKTAIACLRIRAWDIYSVNSINCGVKKTPDIGLSTSHELEFYKAHKKTPQIQIKSNVLYQFVSSYPRQIN